MACINLTTQQERNSDNLSLGTGKFHWLEENLSQAQIGLENREGTINKKAGLNNKKN